MVKLGQGVIVWVLGAAATIAALAHPVAHIVLRALGIPCP